MAFHASQGPTLGLPQMIQSRAQFGYRGVVVALFATLFTYMAFNVADQVLMSEGLNGAFGWNADLVAIVTAIGAALLAIYGHDWVHRVFRMLLYVLLPLMVIVTIGVITGHAGGGPSKVAYGGMLTTLTGIDSFRSIRPTRTWRVITIIVLAVAWYVIAKAITTDAVGAVYGSLTLMLYFLVPWTATNLIDFFFVRRGHYAI